ncbi:integrase catalytic domain-containing protein [Trichonephila clavipes]|nr:integrase catalytic domain-containing protein [Trichonephila clavipes]
MVAWSQVVDNETEWPLFSEPTIETERNILHEWNEICKSDTIQLFSAEEGIEWNFIPPTSPHFGGLWEANIKSMKRILLRVAKSAIMNFNQNAISTFPEPYTASDLCPIIPGGNSFDPHQTNSGTIGAPNI